MIPTAYFVVGVPRSGTSCVAGILHRLGIRMTLYNFIPAGPANPSGFYEDEDLIKKLSQTNRGLLSESASFSEKKDWIREQTRLNSIASEAIKQRCDAGISWGTKFFILGGMSLGSAISASTMPVKIIHTVRPIEDSIASAKLVFEQTEYIREMYYKTNKVLSTCEVPILDITFSELISNPLNTVTNICKFIDKEITIEAVNFINPELRHI